MIPTKPVRLMVLTTIDATLAAFFTAQLRALAAEGFDVHAVSSPGPNLAHLGVPTHAIPMERQPAPFKDLVSLVRLIWLMVRIRPDIVHVHTPKAGLLGMLAAWLVGVKTRLYTLHGLPLETRHGILRRILEGAERTTCALATHVYAVSPSLADLVRTTGLCASHKLSTLGDGSCAGVDVRHFHRTTTQPADRAQWTIPDNALVTCFVGRVARDKGIEVLADAWSILSQRVSTAHLLLCGPLDDSDPVDAGKLRQLRDHPRVHFTGNWTGNVAPIYAASDVCVLPTFREGLGQVALEAAAMELPIVATRVTGVVDAVEDQRTGILVSPGQPAPLAAALELLLTDAERRKKLGSAGRDRVQERFGADRVQRLWIAEYQRFAQGGRARAAAPGLAGVLLVIAFGCSTRSSAQLSVGQSAIHPAAVQAFAQRTGLAFYHEFFGSRVYLTPQIPFHLERGRANGVAFTPPVEAGMAQIADRYDAGLMIRLPASPLAAGISASEIDRQQRAFADMAAASPSHEYLWNLMPEWDQSGGNWVPNRRPSYAGLTREAAHDRFLNYYRTNQPQLIQYLRDHALESPVALAAITDYSPNAIYAYELGAGLCLLERGIDELGDIGTGLAYVRGAADQYQRPWGIDLSTWRSSNNSATRYNTAGRLLGGWSDSYLRRHYFASYFGGANIIHNEAAEYYFSDGRLNPFGEMVSDFSDFSLRRHPNPGKPIVPTALLVDHNSGFDPKHGLYNQRESVWYQDIAYSQGDAMMDQVLRLAFPNHWQHGRAPGAPFADSNGIPNTDAFRNFLANGGDPRPFEPMPTTRWGDSLNILTTAATSTSLAPYRLIILTGDVVLNPSLRQTLEAWVQSGGVLVLNAAQTTAADAALLGASVTNVSATATSSYWVDSPDRNAEPVYRYRRVRPVASEVVAMNDAHDPLLLRHRLGAGEVWLATPDYLLSSNRQLLTLGVQLLDRLTERFTPVRVTGFPIQYVVTDTGTGLVTTLINNSDSTWYGEIAVARGASTVTEWIGDQRMSSETSRTDTKVPVIVPPFDVRVIAVEQNRIGSPQRRERTR